MRKEESMLHVSIISSSFGQCTFAIDTALCRNKQSTNNTTFKLD